MSARSSFFKIASKVGIVFGALFVVSVLLAAIPAHQQQVLQVAVPQDPSTARNLPLRHKMRTTRQCRE